MSGKRILMSWRRKIAVEGVCVLFLCSLLLGGCGGREEEGIRVGSLKGPTSMGILFLMDRAEREETEDFYRFQIVTGADELAALLAKGELDIALVPANLAAVLYHRTDGGVKVIDINTLGVLYIVTGEENAISDISDLRGKTIYLTGKGTTPEASLKYLLGQSGLGEGDYALEFKSEAAEVAAVLAKEPSAVGLLPQPFATAAIMQNENLKIVIDLNAEWSEIQGGSRMVTGVTIVRDDFLRDHEEQVKNFLEEHAGSVDALEANPADGAALAVKAGIVPKESIAQAALPRCNITCIIGVEMKEALSAYLNVLADFDAELVGGAAPGEDFYYLP